MSRLDLPSGRQLLQRAFDQVDVPDIDVQTLWRQLRSDDTSVDAIQLDVADYVHQTPVWMLQPNILKDTFYERIYDPDASPEIIKTQLIKIKRDHLVAWLQERGDLATEQVETVADQLSQIKDTVMAAVASQPSSQPEERVAIEAVEEQGAIEAVQDKLVAYCRYTNLDLLTPENLVDKVRGQLEDHSLDVSHARKLDLEVIEAVLDRRQGLEPSAQQALMSALRSMLPASPLKAPRRWAARSGRSAQHLAEHLTTQLTCYLRHREKSALQPAQMARDLTQLAKTSLGALSHQLPDSLPDSLFDKAVWQRELEKRRDMTADEIQHILAGTESIWQQGRQQVNHWTQTSWSEMEDAVKSVNDDFVESAREQITERISSAQQAIEAQASTVKADLQTQADAARGQVAIASWWLFSSLLLSGISAATSGWLAAKY